ncbi:MAG TPA: nuclear transport factor 2 family protein [Chthonomonadaceae bacterium]|nr:nuclear transport factor 2 family protein [Chthonomonadaceae bacterium]
MTRHGLTICATALILAGGIGAARANDRADIDKLYAKLTAALKNLRPDDTLALEAPGFVSTEPDGSKLNGQQVAAMMKKENEGVKSVKSVSIKIKECKITGKTAKVATDFSFAIVVEDKEGHMGKKGATHVMASSGKVTNDLVKTGDGWKFLSMSQAGGKMTMDGKPMKMPTGGGGGAKAKM